MDEAARLRIIIQALGVREAQRALHDLDRGLHRSAATARSSGHQIEQSAHRSATALSRLGRAGAVGGTAAIAVGFGAAIKAGFKFNAQMESNELAMRRFIGSTAQTQKYLKDLADLAESSPFEFTQLTQGARRMMAFGLSAKQTKATLTAVADAIAAAGGGAERIDQVTLALGQMATKGKVSGEELLQLNEAGIPATKILKRELGLTGEQVGKIGNLGIKSGVAIRALTQGMTRDFKGASKEQATTWDGLMSTLRDKWARTSGDMTKGLFREAKKWAPRIAETLDDIGRIFRRKDLSLGEKIKLSVGTVRRNILDPIGDAVGRMHLGDKLSQAFENAAPRVLKAIGTLARKSVGAFVRAWADAGPWAHFLTMAFLGHKLGVFNTFGRRAANRFTNSFESRASTSMVAGIGNVGRSKGIVGAITSLGKSVGITLAIATAIEFGVRFRSEIGTVLTDAGNWIKGAAATIGESFGEVLPKSPQQRRAERAGRLGVGRGGAGLTSPGSGLGGLPKRWNNPNEGGAGMRGAVMHPRRGGRSGQSLADLRLKTRGAANQRIIDRVDTIDFQLEMGRITAGAAADQLEALAMGVKHNKRLRRQILVSAHNLRQQAAQDARQAAEDAKQERRRAAAHEASERRRAATERRGARAAHQREVRAAKARERKRGGGGTGDFELNVGDVRIPTVYEVRRTRLEQRGRAGHAPVGIAQHSQPTTTVQGGVHIVINGSKSPKETAQEVAAVFDKTRKTHGRAVARARAKKKGHR